MRHLTGTASQFRRQTQPDRELEHVDVPLKLRFRYGNLGYRDFKQQNARRNGRALLSLCLRQPKLAGPEAV